MEKPSKTNACRALDQRRLDYRLRRYTIDLDDLSAEHAMSPKPRAVATRGYETLCVAADDHSGCSQWSRVIASWT
jgi:DUF1365 family protein